MQHYYVKLAHGPLRTFTEGIKELEKPAVRS
jgi:hypothetical protein